MKNSLISAFIALAVGLLVGACVTFSLTRNKAPQTVEIVRTDTITVRDTIREVRPVYVTSTRVDTMLVPVHDTITVRDTAFIVVEREQRHYKGEDYEAWVSGYRPALDSLRVFPETKYITTENIFVESRKRWGIGIQAGYGATVTQGQVRLSPYIGVGISYNIIRF